MTDLRTAAQQALEALEYYRSGEDYQPTPSSEAITSLKAALAEPVEPVAWMVYTEDGKSVCVTDHPADFIEWRSLPLYTAPPQRKPLSEEEIAAVTDEHWPDFVAFARAIEAAHGIKDQG